VDTKATVLAEGETGRQVAAAKPAARPHGG